MYDLELKSGLSVDSPDSEGEVCINIDGDYGEPSVHFYLNKEQVQKILDLFE